MEHLTLWIAFWIVTLSGCFPRGRRTLPLDDSNIDFLLASLICPQDSKFYTPSNLNLEDDCITAALECFRIELKGSVRVECEDPEEYIGQAVEFLERAKNVSGNALTNSTECPCERWPTTNITNFLHAEMLLIQHINRKVVMQ